MRISDWSSDVCSSDLAGFESLCDSRAGQQQRDGEPCENQRHVHFWDGGHPADIGCGHAVLPVQQHLRGGRNKVDVVGDPCAPAFALSARPKPACVAPQIGGGKEERQRLADSTEGRREGEGSPDVRSADLIPPQASSSGMASPARFNGTSLFVTAVIQRTSDADMLSCPSSSICAAAETRWPLSAIRAPRLSP